MKKHFVTFLFHETTEKEIDSWDVEKAKQMATGISERYGATPFGFYFTSRSRGSKDLDSPTYYLGGKVETLEEVKARATEGDRILISNMERHGFSRIITITTNAWKVTQLFNDGDVVLDWTPLNSQNQE